MEEDGKEEAIPSQQAFGRDVPDYDKMNDEEYMAAMEQKVEYYKIHYPDMYNKAQDWLKMLDHSEVYKQNAPADAKQESALLSKAKDLLKNVLFNGFTDEDLTETELSLLNEQIPDWRSTKSIEE